MALINCSECGKEYSDKATACPNCGCPTPGKTDSANESTASPSNTPKTPPTPPPYVAPNVAPPTNAGIPQEKPNGGMKCPKCGSSNLQVISDTHGKGAKLWKLCLCGLLGLCGTGKTQTDHYWVCTNCGNKFKL